MGGQLSSETRESWEPMARDLFEKLKLYPAFAMNIKLGDVLQWTKQGTLHRVGNIAGWVEDDADRAILRHASQHPHRGQPPEPYLRVTKSALVKQGGRVCAQVDSPGLTSTAAPGPAGNAIVAMPPTTLAELELATPSDPMPTTTAQATFECCFPSKNGYVLELVNLTEEEFPENICDVIRSEACMNYLQKGELIVSSITRVDSGAWVAAKKAGTSFTFDALCAAGSTARIFTNATGNLNSAEVVHRKLSKGTVALIGLVSVETTGVEFKRRGNIALEVRRRAEVNRPVAGIRAALSGSFGDIFSFITGKSMGSAMSAEASPDSSWVHQSDIATPNSLEARQFDAPIATPAFLEAHQFDVPIAAPEFLKAHQFDVPVATPEFLKAHQFDIPIATPEFLKAHQFDVPIATPEFLMAHQFDVPISTP